MENATRLTNLEVTGKLLNPAVATHGVTSSDLAASVTAADLTAVSASDGGAAAGDAPTKAEFDAVVALCNELKTKYGATLTLCNELKTKYAAVATLVNEIKGDLNGLVSSLGSDS